MSTSDPIVELLLHGYLDGALEGAELAEIQQLLNEDPELRARLDSMRTISNDLRQIAASDASITLDSGFAERVIDHAVARARDEGLAQDHPLNLVAEQPINRPAARPAVWTKRGLGFAASIAASVAFVAWSSGWLGNDPDSHQTIAKVDTLVDDVAVDEAAVVDPAPTLAIESDAIEGDNDSTAAPLVQDMAVAAKQPPTSPDSKAFADSRSVGLPTNQEQDALLTTNDAAVNPATASSISRPAAMMDQTVSLDNLNPLQQFAPIIVLDIRQTEFGREHDSVSKALRAAQIETGDRRRVTESVAAAAVDAVELTDEDQASIIYLVTTGKSLDRLYSILFDDEEGIRSVSMALSMGGPVLNAIEELQQDPTTVRHDDVTMNRGGDKVEQLIELVDQLGFPKGPMGDNKRGSNKMSLPPSSQGADVPAQLLVVIR